MRTRVRVLSPSSRLLSGYGLRFHVLPSCRAASSLLLVGAGSRPVRRLAARVLPLQPDYDAGLQFQILMSAYAGLQRIACRCGPLSFHQRGYAACRCRSLPSRHRDPTGGSITRGFLPLPRPRPGHGSLPSFCSRSTMEKARILRLHTSSYLNTWHGKTCP